MERTLRADVANNLNFMPMIIIGGLFFIFGFVTWLNGPHISTGSALLIMGISGGAILPFVYGIMSDITGDLKFSYIIMLPCYLFIIFYSLKGYKMRSWKATTN